MKNVDLDEPTRIFWDALNGECKPNEIVTRNYRCVKNLTQRRLLGPTIWKDMRKRCF